ncbi:RICIN domain-containing protein [Streptomyces sp. NPDC006530]|uniref:RICIN domain-containing protein n=1 Tax=Streptomyces sp. NPDC006530 TaxID=3364750 RepID=UPI003690900B
MSRTIRAALIGCASLALLSIGAATAQASPNTAAAQGGLVGQLQVKYRDKCLAVADGSLSNGAHVVEGECDSSADSQVFNLKPDTSGWELVAEHSGRCLTFNPASAVEVTQQWCSGTSSQRWLMEFLDGAETNLMTLRPQDAPAECLSMGGTPAGEEPLAYVVSCFNNLPSQQWRIMFRH